jgi:alpha-L-fucosidase
MVARGIGASSLHGLLDLSRFPQPGARVVPGREARHLLSWGAWCVAAFGSEWYPRNMYNQSGNSSEYQQHMSTFGDPFGDWPYDKFLTGANDKSGKLAQFAPKLKSEGGAWDPDEWAQMFLDAGAKFAGPVVEHHDGFSMWDSKVNEWNSVAMGPKLDLGKLQTDAIRKKGLKLIMSHHTAYNFTGYYQWAPMGATDSLKKLYGQLPNATEQTLRLDKLKEIIDHEPALSLSRLLGMCY